jgi:anaphase-promoting complex subunit 4
VRLVGLENSKAVHQIHVTDDSSAGIQFIAWSRNHTGRRARGRSPATSEDWRQLLGDLQLDDKKEVLDLPHELTFLEVDTALPKLSPLPVSGGSG